MASENTPIGSLLNWQVFGPPAVLLVLVLAIGLAVPDAFGAGAEWAREFTLEHFSWFYALGSAALLAFCFWAGFSRFGSIRLGGPRAKPELSIFRWWAISICAGIAIGIVFYSVGEPITHYLEPPPFLGVEPGSLAAGESALRYTFLHWSFHPYGLYVSAGICIAFAFYNTKRPFRVSSSLFPLVGHRSEGVLGHWIDGLAVFAIVGGVGTSLGFGTMQIGGGLEFLWGVEPTPVVWLGIIVALTAVYTVSSYTGLQRGIRFLSENNIRLYLVLMAFVLVTGPTLHILNSTVTALGDYLSNVVAMSLHLDPMAGSGWARDWSIVYWAWWLAYAPIVGLFLVRLAYGRTIREFVLVNLIGPALFAFVWFGIFGNAAIYLEHFKDAGIGEIVAEHGIEVSLFALFQNLPYATVTIVLGVAAVAISFVTLADSMTSTIASMTTRGYGESMEEREAPAPMKIFWGVGMGLLSFLLLITGGARALQSSVIVCALPILVLQIAMVVAYCKAMFDLKTYDIVGTNPEDDAPGESS
jgi:glycine betaine transporter